MVNVTIFHHNFFQKEKTAIMMSLNHASYALSYFIFTMTVEGRCVHCPFYTNEKGRQRDYYETPSRSHRYKLLVCFSKPQAVRLLSPCCLYYKARSCKVVGQDNEEEAAWGHEADNEAVGRRRTSKPGFQDATVGWVTQPPAS